MKISWPLAEFIINEHDRQTVAESPPTCRYVRRLVAKVSPTIRNRFAIHSRCSPNHGSASTRARLGGPPTRCLQIGLCRRTVRLCRSTVRRFPARRDSATGSWPKFGSVTRPLMTFKLHGMCCRRGEVVKPLLHCRILVHECARICKSSYVADRFGIFLPWSWHFADQSVPTARLLRFVTTATNIS